ncbi:MAG TPA: hypothetical protein VM076_20260 [Gemmatimonadaceae bacterium]|nr:hypothetical protein [Gemmatimonadaceae bacterium]
MKPTVYLRLADLRPAGNCPPNGSALSRFSAGRIAMRRLWIEAEGRQVGVNDHTNTAGSSGPRGTA